MMEFSFSTSKLGSPLREDNFDGIAFAIEHFGGAFAYNAAESSGKDHVFGGKFVDQPFGAVTVLIEGVLKLFHLAVNAFDEFVSFAVSILGADNSMIEKFVTNGLGGAPIEKHLDHFRDLRVSHLTTIPNFLAAVEKVHIRKPKKSVRPYFQPWRADLEIDKSDPAPVDV